MSLRQTIKWTQYRGLVRTTDAAAEPVTAEELQTFLRATDTQLPDAQADDFVTQARNWIEELTGLALINQTWNMFLDEWPQRLNDQWWSGVRQGSITELYSPANLSSVVPPRYPLSSLSNVYVYDEDGTETEVTISTTFDVDTAQKPGRVTLKRGATWPVAMKANNAIKLVFVAGYGSLASDVPVPLKRAVLQLAAYLYSHRGDGCDMGTAFKDSGARELTSLYTVQKI